MPGGFFQYRMQGKMSHAEFGRCLNSLLSIRMIMLSLFCQSWQIFHIKSYKKTQELNSLVFWVIAQRGLVKQLDTGSLKMEQTGCPETSMLNQPILRNNPKTRKNLSKE